MKNTTYNCKTCGEETKWSHQKMNVYCSNPCAAEGKLQESVERLLRGEITQRSTIRRALIRLRGDECEVCGITEWNGKPIVFQVDHINGLANDNSPENLRLICANCHSQTPHFGGKNKGNGRAALGLKTN